MTSTLQQEASRKLRYSAQTTMRLAQRLYENGYITYMRTDSTTLSESALTAAREQVASLFGADYVPPEPRRYERKVKNAQEAHEAIRPSGDRFRTPQDVRSELSPDEHALYELVWMRTLASQMKDAQGQTVSLRIAAESSASETVELGASGTVITFRGFLAAYEEGRDEDRAAHEDDEERRLPNLSEGDPVELRTLEPQGHETSPPARYTEATLVRTLEELGIGRPSTYASILGTILDRGYVFKRGTALVPAFLAFSVVGLLEKHFGRLVDYDFTASMEDDLDRIAAGDEQRVEWLGRFYFGDGPATADGASSPGLHELVSDLGAIDAREINSLEIGDGIVLRVGRYGPYLERDGQRASVPEELAPDELTVERAERRSRARHRPGDRAADRRAHRALRPVRHRGPARGLEGEAADRLPLQDDGAGHDRARRRAPPPPDSACGRDRRGRGGGRRAKRPLRAVRPEGEGVALARIGGAALHRRPARRGRPPRPAPATPRAAVGRDEAAPRARHRPGRRQ